MSEKNETRVRFAPSPTGELHVGSARTALFNWLFARHFEGTFILRIEDTDEQRSRDESLEGIVEGLSWLGLDWDEGPIYQSDRLDLYSDYVSLLMNSGHAYYCFCSVDDLDARRKEAQEQGEVWRYDGRCRHLDADEVRTKIEAEEPKAIRFKVPTEGSTTVHDDVFGDVEVAHENIEDFVLMRSDEKPTYHLSNVVDDIEMGISHVIRGADHLSNTPKQILVYEALNATAPRFAHLPLILGSDQKRLSKRHGSTSVISFRDKGFLPGAVVNYLALLGWSPGDDREIFTIHDLTREFELKRVNSSNAIFDSEKLAWMNGQYISKVPAGELRLAVRDALHVRGCWHEELDMERRDYFFALIEMWQSRSRTISELTDNITPFLTEAFPYQPDAIREHVRNADLLGPIEALREAFLRVDPWTQEELEGTLREVAAGLDLEAADLIHTTRVAIVGKKGSPGIFEVLDLMGRDKTRVRMDRMLRYLRKIAAAKTARAVAAAKTARAEAPAKA